ncbi:MAG: hypothetical protein JSW70_06720 [Syntrophobacterales bacterium]|nr:MAG: hypothetical protein JSW70_06720 [Syntrophobacterales bacterium]
MPKATRNDAPTFLNERQTIQTFVTTTLVIMALLSCSMARLGTMVDDIPREVNGWVANPEVRQYEGKTLYKYIDGGAELYLAYGFHKAYVHTYTKPGEPDIIMDIYDMSTPEDAFGVFTAEREGDDIGIGTGSEYEGGLLRFSKGRFFVSIMTHEEKRQSRKAVLSLARAVANAIQPIGERPKLLLLLPDRGLIERSIRYFHDHNILSLNYYVSDENILHLGSHTEAVLARYSAEGKPYLLLIHYPSVKHAKAAFRSFLHAYMPDAVEPGIVQTENGTWTAVGIYSTFVAVVFEAPSDGWARSILEALCTKLGEKR